MGNPRPTSATACSSNGPSERTADHRCRAFRPRRTTWSRWSRETGRDSTDLDYWSAFGAAVIVVTATRAMVQWGLADPFVEEVNGLVPRVGVARRSGGAVNTEPPATRRARRRTGASLRPRRLVVERVVVLLVDRPRRRTGGVLPGRAAAEPEPGHALVLRARRRRVGRHRGDPLRFEDFDLTDGIAYDRWGLRFGWRPAPPTGALRVRRECPHGDRPRRGRARARVADARSDTDHRPVRHRHGR